MPVIRMFKLVTGENVIGKDLTEDSGGFDTDTLHEVATVQIVPQQNGMSVALVPYNFPFAREMKDKVAKCHIISEIKDIPEELLNKYVEATSGIAIVTAAAMAKLKPIK